MSPSVGAGRVAIIFNRKLAPAALGDGMKHTFDLGPLPSIVHVDQ